MSTSSSRASRQGRQRPVASLVDILEEVVGGRVDEPLLSRALTHRSFSYEHGGVPHNERLEFLGDSVLGVVVTDTLYRAHEDMTEGQLAKLRASVVNSRALADVGGALGLGEYVALGRGEETTGGRQKASILADTTEAVIGAVYLSCGLDAAARLVHHLLDEAMDSSAKLGAGLDWKTSLQELTSELGLGVPAYDIEESGPDHLKVFSARVHADAAEILGTGSGRSKKVAEQKAAEQAWTLLQERQAAGASDASTGPDHGSPEDAATGSGDGPASDASTDAGDARAEDAGPVPDAVEA